ncbi:DNA cytosine methyltransferase [Ochrobactrum daejeonense]|nr:DNA cytosine methyltransferase [Brucella daejeonensis]NKB80128.1 DNA cytosine methyltransferase [Brucella daejeonensis]
MSKLRALSLFAGIGGFDLGLERTGGFEIVGQCEIEPFQRAVLRKHWPEVQHIEDIHDIERFDCDVICGGFPCQPFSTASRGRRVAVDLWPEMRRVIDGSDPSYVIAENVSEYAIEIAADDLRTLGYNIAIRNISAHDCGAPHGRSRWWLVAHPTRKANFNAPSMQKWPSCRNYVRAFGTQKPTPEQFEFLMGYPIGFTELKHSETLSFPKFHK